MKIENQSRIRISFLGDISLNGNYINLAEKSVNPFHEVEDILSSSDYVVGNLEAMLESKQGVNLFKIPRLSTTEKALGLILNLNINLVTLANNHVFDNLYNGLEKTIHYLDKQKIEHIGASTTQENPSYHRMIKSINGIKIGFLNYVHPNTNPKLPPKAKISLSLYHPGKIIQDIKQLNQLCDISVVLLHWGYDNSFFPEKWQREDAKSFADAGVNVIVGHHTHTLQGYETIGKTHVFYGLGNFCFSDFISEGQLYQLDERRQTESAILHMNIVDKKISFDFSPIRINKNIIEKGGQKVLKKINRRSNLIKFFANDFIWSFYILYLNIAYKLYYFFFGNDRKPIDRLKTLNRKKIHRFFTILKQVFTKK